MLKLNNHHVVKVFKVTSLGALLEFIKLYEHRQKLNETMEMWISQFYKNFVFSHLAVSNV